MRYTTNIDTLKIQIEMRDESAREMLVANIANVLLMENCLIDKHSYSTSRDASFFVLERKFYKNNTVVASIRTGVFGMKDHKQERVITTHYASIEFAGLASLNQEVDEMKLEILLKVCAFLNSSDIHFKITGIDIAIDLYTKMSKVLALCTKKSPRTKYYAATEPQLFDTTHYIEKIMDGHKDLVVQRSYIYNKTVKENMSGKEITRFELKLQTKFFNKHRENIIAGIAGALDKYHVMYIPNKKEKYRLMQGFDNCVIAVERNIKKFGFDNYRCYPDIATIDSFIKKIYSVRL